MGNPTDIFERNMAREQLHEGETKICRKCSKGGVVGEDLWAAFDVTADAEFWIHESCTNWRQLIGGAV